MCNEIHQQWEKIVKTAIHNTAYDATILAYFYEMN
jgi:hypothetical protein